MLTQEHIICSKCGFDQWWESTSKVMPRTGALKEGWFLNGQKWKCPYCRGIWPRFKRAKKYGFRRKMRRTK